MARIRDFATGAATGRSAKGRKFKSLVVKTSVVSVPPNRYGQSKPKSK